MKAKVTGGLVRLREMLTLNVGYRLVSLLFALVLWIWVQSEQRVEDRVRAKVQWLLPDGLALVEPPIEQVTLTVEGVQALMRSLKQRNLYIEVDLSKAQEGDVSVDLSQRKIEGLPVQLNVLGVSPASLRVTLDRMFRRKVSVVASAVGTPPEGYRVASITVDPPRAEIEGPVSVLRGLENVPTEDIDLGGLREDGDFDVGLQLRKGLAPSAKSGRFTVHISIEAIANERVFAAVPVVIRQGDYAAAVASLAVTLSGPTDLIAKLNADEISVMVYLPEGYDDPLGVARRGKQSGPRFEVVHGGGSEIEVVRVEPDTIPIARRAAP